MVLKVIDQVRNFKSPFKSILQFEEAACSSVWNYGSAPINKLKPRALPNRLSGRTVEFNLSV